MTAPVRIDAEAWGDLRFQTLARILGFADQDHALIKVARLWSWQAEHYTPDTPTYVVDQDTIESAIGEGGAAAMVRSRLAEEVPDGYRIKGTEGRIEWLWKRRQASKHGGEATKRKHSHKEGPDGPPSAPSRSRRDRALEHDEPDPPASNGEGGNKRGPDGRPELGPEPGPNRGPNQGPLSLLPDLVSGDPDLPPRARAIPPDDPKKSLEAELHETDRQFREHRELHRRKWDALGDLRRAIARELGVEARPLHTQDAGTRALSARIREAESLDRAAADIDHVLAIAGAEARDKRTVQWLTGAMFEEKSWRRALGMTLDDVKQRRDCSAAKPQPERPRMREFK